MTEHEKQEALKALLLEFFADYAGREKAVKLQEWLASELKKHLPGKRNHEVWIMSREIISSLLLMKEKRKSLDGFTAKGRSKESWLAREVHDYPITTERLTRNVPEITAICGEVIESSGTVPPEVSGTITAELESGDTLGLKAAASGAVMAGAESGLMGIPEEDRALTASAVAFQGIETAEILCRELPLEATADELERSAVSVGAAVVSALEGANAGAELGTKIGSVFGWLGRISGAVVGGTVGGIAGCMAGGRIGGAVIARVKKISTKLAGRFAEYAKKSAICRTAPQLQ